MDNVQKQLGPLLEPPEDSESLAGKILGYDENGNLVAIDPPKAEEQVEIFDDGTGNIVLLAMTDNVVATDDGAGNVI